MTNHSDDLQHIASCRTCRDRFTAGNAVSFAADRHREPERMREFLETARRLERERAGVEETVARLLRTTPPSEWSALAAAPELQSSAAVEQLIEEVRNRVERTPADALALANVATTIAESLPEQSYPPVVLAQLTAAAWKEKANTLRFLSRFDEALVAVETAQERLKNFPATAFDRAVVHLTRATILAYVNRLSEAYELLPECRQVFLDHGDSKMLLFTGIIEGAWLYDDARYSEAHALFLQMLDIARKIRDTESLARIENNLGYCATELGDYRTANIHFSNAIAFFNDVGCVVEATRTEHGAGLLLIAKGQVSAGLARLRNARTAFAAASLNDEAAIAGLEIVEILVRRGDVAEGKDLAHEIATEVATAGLSERAVNAVKRLDAVLLEADVDAAYEVRSVHELLKSLQQSLSAR
jgi:tetratricopeptide (TPR) repeat protein